MNKQSVNSDNIFTLNQVCYYYPRSNRPALRNLNLEVREGEFLLLIGRSGSGKSTLARAMCALIPDFYGGDMTGQIDFMGVPLTDWPKNRVAEKVGIVFQEPSKQLFYKNVERDIAFGLENLGFDNDLMHRRVAEVLDFMDLSSLRTRDSRLISGGEQQKIALAGVLAMGPQVLILDEPTSQLDPVAAAGFLNLLRDLNQEGITVVLIEQRLDKAFDLADRVIVMEAGEIIYQGDKTEQLRWAFNNNYPLVPAVPAIFAAGANNTAGPVTIKEGRRMLRAMGADKDVPPYRSETNPKSGEPLVEINKLTFAYPDSLPAINNLHLKIWPGEFVALIGSNGAGKSTLLQVTAGLLGGYKGNVRIGDVSGKRLKAENLKHQVAYLPQNLDDFFLADTVVQDIMLAGKEVKETPNHWLEALELIEYRDDDPRKLSTGEKQRAALAAILASDPAVVLLDEPTTGVDREHKKKLGKLLGELCRQQKTIVLVTHDIDFASEYADRIVFMHEGNILAEGSVNEQIPKNIFYTSQAARLFQPFDRSIINEAQAAERIRILGRD